jgi:hypothetical protein
MKRAILALGLVLAWAGTASSATYYVDCNANGDAGAGTSTAAAVAWKTVSKVNASSFSAGDSVLFNKGCTWRETVTPPSNGSAGNVITFGAYGSGLDPIITGADLKNTAGDWTQDGASWYLSGITTDPGIVLHDGTLGFRRLLKASLAATWDYWWDDPNDRLYVYAAANPTTLATNIEVGARDNAVYPVGLSYLTFQNLTFVGTRSNAFAVFWGGAGHTVTSCTFKNIGKYGMQWNNGATGGVVSNSTFIDFGVIDGQQYAIQVIANGATESGPVDITGNTFTLTQKTNVTECMPVMSDAGGWVRTFSNNVVNGNTYMMGAGITVWRPASTATSITFEHNTITGMGSSGLMIQEPEFAGAHPIVLIRYNSITNTCLTDTADTEALRIRSFTTSTPVTVAYNVINGTYDGAQVHHGIQAKDADGAAIYNNVIVGADNGIEVNDEAGAHSTGLSVLNNISANNRGYGLNLGAANTITTWGYNLWYGNVSGTLNGKAAGTGDVTTDPLFLSASNFHLQLGSPAIKRGVGVGLLKDFDNKTIWDIPSIGAYESQVPGEIHTAEPIKGSVSISGGSSGQSLGGGRP